MISDVVNTKIDRSNSRRKFTLFLSNWGTLIGMILVFPLFGLLAPNFLSVGNMLNILRQSAILTLLGVGLTFVLAVGMFDISIAAVCGLTSISMALVLAHGYGFPLAVAVAIVVGLLTGLVNGLLVAKLHINDFLTTVAMMFIAVGFDVLLDKGANVHIDFAYATELRFLGKGYFLGIPTGTIFLIIIAIIAYIVLEKTKFGRELYAIGGNARSAHLSGVQVERLRMAAFIICGLIVALAGIMLTARLEGGKPRGGETLLGDSIAAASIGTTFLRRGRPHILGTLFGGIFLATLANGFVFLNIDFYYQYIVRGLAIVGAVGFSGVQFKRK